MKCHPQVTDLWQDLHDWELKSLANHQEEPEVNSFMNELGNGSSPSCTIFEVP